MTRRRITIDLSSLVAGLAIGAVLVSGTAYSAAKITGQDIKNNSVSGKDVKNNSVSGKDIKKSSLTTSDVRNGTLVGADIAAGSLRARDVGVLTAKVNASGTAAPGSGATSSSKVFTGGYEVVFDRDVTRCTFTASLGTSTGELITQRRSGVPNAVFVGTYTSAGAAADRAFSLIVAC